MKLASKTNVLRKYPWFALVLLVFLTGARSLYIPTDMPHDASNDATLTQIDDTIVKTVKYNAWIRVESNGEGEILASRQWGGGSGTKHQMTIKIEYDEDSFSILYVSSIRLDYNGRKIHRSYNRFVRDLEDAIQFELARL